MLRKPVPDDGTNPSSSKALGGLIEGMVQDSIGSGEDEEASNQYSNRHDYLHPHSDFLLRRNDYRSRCVRLGFDFLRRHAPCPLRHYMRDAGARRSMALACLQRGYGPETSVVGHPSASGRA